MKKFKNTNTGLIEVVYNKKVIEQYEKYPEIYIEVKEKTPVKTNK